MSSIALEYHAQGLLPYDVLPDITDPGWNPDPLVVECDNVDAPYALALGVLHRTDYDIGNQQFRVLSRNALRFLRKTEGRNRIILVEGGTWPVSCDLDSAYPEGGETQWLQTYGSEHGIRVMSPEPPRDGADLLLSEGFSRDTIALYYFVRQAPQWQRLTVRPGFETYIQGKMDEKARQVEWDNYDFSFKSLVALYEDTYRKPFNKDDTAFFYDQSVRYMRPASTDVQRASVVCNMGRDIMRWETVRRYFGQGVSIFDVSGLTHTLVMRGNLMQLDEKAAHRLGGIALDKTAAMV